MSFNAGRCPFKSTWMCRQCVRFLSGLLFVPVQQKKPACAQQVGQYFTAKQRLISERKCTLYLHYREKIPKEKTQQGNFFREKFDLFFCERRKMALPCGFFSPLIPRGVTKGGL
ncbi:hypothetical protein LJB68_11285 [bacterium 210820-DFI.6.52]|nr:hypothetical protein [bacterium 210820-DFI.6.52]